MAIQSLQAGNLSVLPDELIVRTLKLADEEDRNRMSQTCQRLAVNALEASPLMRCIKEQGNYVLFTLHYSEFFYYLNIRCFNPLLNDSLDDISARVRPHVRTLHSEQDDVLDIQTLRHTIDLDRAPTPRNDWSNLTEVVLDGTFRQLWILPQLIKLRLPQLSALTISIENERVSPRLYTRLLQEFITAYQSQLECLRIDHCARSVVSDSTMRALASCSKLEGLAIPGAEVSSDALAEVARSCTQLQYLDLSGCNNVTDEIVEELATRCFDLKRINLSGCNQLTANSVHYLSIAENLECMELRECALLTDKEALAQIVADATKGKGCHKLRYFELEAVNSALPAAE